MGCLEFVMDTKDDDSGFQAFIERCEKEALERSKIFTLPKGAIVRICGAPVVLQDEIEALGDPLLVKHVIDLHERLDAEDSPCDYVGENISFNDFRELNPIIKD